MGMVSPMGINYLSNDQLKCITTVSTRSVESVTCSIFGYFFRVLQKKPKNSVPARGNTMAHKGHAAKLKNVAANFQNELLQIKTSEVCARTKGRRSGY